MSVWLVLLVPIIGAIVAYFLFKKRLTWWEILIPLVVSVGLTFGMKALFENFEKQSDEYWGGLAVRAEYYESYETWDHETCTRTYTDADGNTHTETYDCSHCDYSGPEWVLINNIGEKWNISQETYQYLIQKWKVKQVFNELNRSIDYHGGCGDDGDMYSITWDGVRETAEITSSVHTYENRVKASRNSFSFLKVEENDVKQYGLYEYPEVKGYTQNNVLGINQVKWLTPNEQAWFVREANFINGNYGPKKHVRVYFLFFVDKPSLAAKMQEAYWVGGNGNELVVCIGLSSKTKKTQWVAPFTWSPVRRIVPDIREDIMKSENFDVQNTINVVEKHVNAEFKRMDFAEFSYISVEIPTWSKVVIWIIVSMATFGIFYWNVSNEFVPDENNPLKTKENYFDSYRPW